MTRPARSRGGRPGGTDLTNLIALGAWADAQNYAGRGWVDSRIDTQLWRRYPDSTSEDRAELIRLVRMSRNASSVLESLEESESLDPDIVPEVPGLQIGSFLTEFIVRITGGIFGRRKHEVGRVVTEAPPAREDVERGSAFMVEQMIAHYGMDPSVAWDVVIKWVAKSPGTHTSRRGTPGV